MEFYLVDVFAEEKYQGNQLAVFVLQPGQSLTDQEMLQIAQETRQTETSFVFSSVQQDGGYTVRFFEPRRAVPFSGHAALGTAYVIHEILEQGRGEVILLDLPVGQVPVEIKGEQYTLLHNQPTFGMTVAHLSSVLGAIGIREEDLDLNYPVQWVSTGKPSIIVPLKTTDAVERCVVNLLGIHRFLLNYGGGDLLVFAPEEGKDQTLWVRAFRDIPGYFEDVAAGSGAGNLAAYLLGHQVLGKNEVDISVIPCYALDRPSQLTLTGKVEGGAYTIRMGGQVKLMAKGEWL